jgi:type IV secretion system protein TrbL
MEGGIASAKIPGEASSLGGMAQLVFVAERGLMVVLRIAFEIWASISLGNLMAGVYGVLLALPYIILIIVYFSQVVVSIFRVMMFSALSPILMLALGFGWGRGMAITGIRTVFAAFMVLFGSTLALALCLYGAASLDIQNTENVREITSIDNPGLWVAIVLGWMGTAFMAEATGMANSIAGSQLTNQAAAVITAGMTATGLTIAKYGKDMTMKHGIGGVVSKHAGTAVEKGAKGAGYAGAFTAHYGSQAIQAGAQAVRERLSKPLFDRGDKS